MITARTKKYFFRKRVERYINGLCRMMGTAEMKGRYQSLFPIPVCYVNMKEALPLVTFMDEPEPYQEGANPYGTIRIEVTLPTDTMVIIPPAKGRACP